MFDGFCPHNWEEDSKGLRCRAKCLTQEEVRFGNRSITWRAGPGEMLVGPTGKGEETGQLDSYQAAE